MVCVCIIKSGIQEAKVTMVVEWLTWKTVCCCCLQHLVKVPSVFRVIISIFVDHVKCALE